MQSEFALRLQKNRIGDGPYPPSITQPLLSFHKKQKTRGYRETILWRRQVLILYVVFLVCTFF